MQVIREKSEKLTAYLEYTMHLLLLTENCPDASISMITPRNKKQRGSQISIDIAGRERQRFDNMIAEEVIADGREPCVIRLAPVPLYNSFEDVFVFCKVMRKLMA